MFVNNFGANILGVNLPPVAPSYDVDDSGLGHNGDGVWQIGDEPRLCVNIFFNGGGE